MISKFKLGSDDYLMEQADIIIGKLVKEKDYLIKAYNYYQGFRDRYLFLHLEINYGVGNPTSIKFTPLIRKHIDAIVGEYLTTKILPKISCKDKKTLTNIMRDKQLEIALKNLEYVKLFLENSIYNAIELKPQQNLLQVDAVIEQQIKEILNSVNRNFISNYEIAALNIVEHTLQSNKLDFKNKIKEILLDLLIAGLAYFKVIPTASKHNYNIEIDDPLNTFVFLSPDSKYMKEGTMSVVRKWLTREEISIKYGDLLSDEDIKNLEAYSGYTNEDDRVLWIAALYSRKGMRMCAKGILSNEVTPTYNTLDHYGDLELIPIYEVEWIDYSKKGKKGILYNVTRIGNEIYILDGENEFMCRSLDDPNEARLSINGMYYTNRSGYPYSLMLVTADLQD